MLNPNFTAMRLALTPRIARWLSRFCLLGVLAVPPALLLIPWQQTVHGRGRAMAYSPKFRTQYLVSPIEGRVKKWYFNEGDAVKAGQRVAELIDNDPMLEMRLEQERQALLDRRTAAQSRITQIESAVSNLQASFAIQKALQRTFVDIEMENLTRAKQEEIDAKAALVAAEQNEKRMKDLFPKGASERDVELAVRDTVQSKARLESAQANINLRGNAVQAARDLLDRIDKDMLTAVARENASLGTAQAELGAADAAVVQVDVRISRQRAQYIDSPCDGVVYRLLANAEMGGMLVRPGDRLATIVPDIKVNLQENEGDGMPAAPGLVAELYIDGNDLPLVRKGDPVRLQFEGWPAVQFVAMPEAAAGTFGGRVLLVDPAGNERGQFRILVEPDPEDEKDPTKRWPKQNYLRQGVQAQGWVVLDSPANRVTLGWELWRQLNGFPIARPLDDDNKPRKDSRLGPVR